MNTCKWAGDDTAARMTGLGIIDGALLCRTVRGCLYGEVVGAGLGLLSGRGQR